MLEGSQGLALEKSSPTDPYGDVALGVECAWPESIPTLIEEQDA
jgi:hypothetical protein